MDNAVEFLRYDVRLFQLRIGLMREGTRKPPFVFPTHLIDQDIKQVKTKL